MVFKYVLGNLRCKLIAALVKNNAFPIMNILEVYIAVSVNLFNLL